MQKCYYSIYLLYTNFSLTFRKENSKYAFCKLISIILATFMSPYAIWIL